MKIKNREMSDKLKDAFKKAGIELPAKQEIPIGRESKQNHNLIKSTNSRSRKADQPASNKQAMSRNTNLAKSRKQKNSISKNKANHIDNSSLSSTAIIDAYGSSSEGNHGNNNVKNLTPEKTILNAKEGSHFEINPIFNRKQGDSHTAIIDERPCVTQISPGSNTEVQLVIGLDLGTSMTKVIIGDPDQKRFYAVPLSPGSENPYLISTSIIKDKHHNIIIDAGDSPHVLRNIKLDLMMNESNEAIVHLAGFVAQIIRRSIRWFLDAHEDDYSGMHLFWTMTLGLPVDSVRQPELESRFRLAAIAGAQAAISQDFIAVANLGAFIKQVEEDLSNLKLNAASSCFDELGGDPGVVAVVPEIAAQVVGLYRSLRWESKNPISFLMDIGAGTVDAAVFSLVDAKQEGKELAFCAFSCNVSELGVINLHQSRIDWLQENLPDNLSEREDVVAFLANLKRFDGVSIAVPANIDDYINHVEIVRGRSNPDTDMVYKMQLYNNVYQGVLLAAKRKSEGDSVWCSLRTLICGGGARSAFYREFIQGISKNSSLKLQLEVLEKPHNLEAPGLPATEYDRLSVAYGLAQGTQWEYRWPESMEEIPHTRRDRTEVFISKDMV